MPSGLGRFSVGWRLSSSIWTLDFLTVRIILKVSRMPPGGTSMA